MAKELVEHLAQISSLSKEAMSALSSIIQTQQVRKNQDLQQKVIILNQLILI